MRFTLSIDLDNDAFAAPADGTGELGRTLRQLGVMFDDSASTLAALEGGKVRDVNGNTVGAWQVSR